MLHADCAGTFFTEPQRAPSMKATFGKLHVQGFRSLQNILTATVMSRSHSTSEASEVDCSEHCSYTQLGLRHPINVTCGQHGQLS